MISIVAPGPSAPAPPGVLGDNHNGHRTYELAISALVLFSFYLALMLRRVMTKSSSSNAEKGATTHRTLSSEPQPAEEEEPGSSGAGFLHGVVESVERTLCFDSESPQEQDPLRVVVICYNNSHVHEADQEIQRLQSMLADKVEEVKPQSIEYIKVVHPKGTTIRGPTLQKEDLPKKDGSPGKAKAEPATILKVLERKTDENGTTMFRVDADEANVSGEAWVPEKHKDSKGTERSVCQPVKKTITMVHPKGASIRGASLGRKETLKSCSSPGKAKLEKGDMFDYSDEKTVDGVRFYKVPKEKAGTSEDGWVPETHTSNDVERRVCDTTYSELAAWTDVQQVLDKNKVALVKLLACKNDMECTKASAVRTHSAFSNARFVWLSDDVEETVKQLMV